MLASLAIQNVGASYAKHLFGLIGPAGMTGLRIGMAACILIIVRRSWRNPPSGKSWLPVLKYGLAVAAMNGLIYQSFARIPIGIAVAIEILGPLAIVLAGARKPTDVLWLLLAIGGLALLIPWHQGAGSLDLVGIGCALGAAISWALYILFGKKASSLADVDALSWGMFVAALLSLPSAGLDAGGALLSPQILLAGVAVAALSSAIPYSLEMLALRRLTARSFGVLIGTAPAMAALAGLILLGELLTISQWLAVGLIGRRLTASPQTPA